MKNRLSLIFTTLLGITLITGITLSTTPAALPVTSSVDQTAISPVQLSYDTQSNNAGAAGTISDSQTPTTTPDNPNPTPVPEKSQTAVKQPAPVVSKPSPAVSKPSNSISTKAASIMSTAKQYIGVKYLWGGTTPAGFDCSGFTQYVFARNGISLPRVSRGQYNLGKTVSLSNLQPGDLIFFSLAQDGNISHVGIYTGNGQFINASTSKGVTIYSLSSYWTSRYVGAKRIL